MKKWLILISVVLVASLITFNFLFPSTQTETYDTIVKCPPRAVARQIVNKEKWKNWWPGRKISDSVYSFENCNYKIGEILLNGFKTVVYHDKDSVSGLLQFIYFGTDSTQLKWTSVCSFSKNPLKRISQKKDVKTINDASINLVNEMKNYFAVASDVYGMKITEEKVKDSTMIAFKQTFDHYPTTEEIYGMIRSVQKYVKEKGGIETNYPMLNVHKEGPSRYETMVAVPTNKDLPANGKFELKKMVLGNILEAQVTGGTERVKEGEKELANYVDDHQKISPAIPFQSLVTDRISEPDSTKWITRLYYPIFY
jgi:ribosomal protein L30/L7E